MIRKSIIILISAAGILSLAHYAMAEIKIVENADYIFSINPYLRTDVVTLKNVVDLDSKNSDDSTTYIGIDYSLGFDLKSKESGPQAFIKLERNGPYDYDAPVSIHNTLMTSTVQVERYKRNRLLPQVEEFWADLPFGQLPFRMKSGLFTYNVGHGFASGSSYENYSFSLYSEDKDIEWHLYYCKPDLANKNHLGPRIKQERAQGIDYEHNKANFFAADVKFPFGNNIFQPYTQILLDRTGDSRSNLFSMSTHRDLLGILGIAWDLTLKKLSLGLEAARNFGKAKTSDSTFKDVRHTGYLIYATASYDIDKFIPHFSSIVASGNKVTTEMIDNGDTALTSGKNRAFSSYSPLNVNLADSIYPNVEAVPLVAMGGGNGLNYGINRPGTFADPRLFENIILANLGLEYKLTDRLSLDFDWWYLRAMEKGAGIFSGVSKELSSDLGQEIDLSFNYAFNDKVTLSLLSGYFFPGKFYKEERDDMPGSLFTPFVRGDGGVSGAYQVELSLTLTF